MLWSERGIKEGDAFDMENGVSLADIRREATLKTNCATKAGTFSEIAEDVVATYSFKDGDVSKVTKEIQFSHRLIKAET